jgi:uncharacterized protein YraI
MFRTHPGKSSAAAAMAALTLAAPLFVGVAGAQTYYPPPGVGLDVYPPPGPMDAYSLPREAVGINPPSHEAVDVNQSPHDAVGVPAQQISGTTTPISAVSMRAGPGTENPVIGTLHPGVPVQLLAIANHGWMQVQSPAGTGWVYGSYLASGTSAAIQATANTSSPTPTDGANPPSGGDHQSAAIDSRSPGAGHQPIPVNDQPTAASHLPPGVANPALYGSPPLKPAITSP